MFYYGTCACTCRSGQYDVDIIRGEALSQRLLDDVMTLCVCRSGRHEVYIVRGEALAQRLLQLLQVLDVAGGSRLPDRLQRRRHQRALPRVRQSLDDVTARAAVGRGAEGG